MALGRRRAVGRHLAQVGALARVLGEAGRDQPPDVGRNRAELGLGVHDAVHDRGGGDTAAAERYRAGRGEREHRAEREHVAPGTGRQRLHLLGRHVTGRPDDRAGGSQPGVGGRPGDAEVDHPRPVQRQQHVGGLEVAVHQASRVDCPQRLGQPGRQPPDRGRRQRPVPGHHVLQGRPGHERGRQPGRVVVQARRHHRGGVPAADLLRRLRLVAEPPDELSVPAQVGMDDLDRDDSARQRRGEEHLPHAARAQPGEQPELSHCAQVVRGQRVHGTRLLRRWSRYGGFRPTFGSRAQMDKPAP